MRKPLENREDQLEAVRSLVLQGVKTAAISRQTGVKAKTIRTWARRYGWGVLASNNGEMACKEGDSTLGHAIKNDSERVKRRLADVVKLASHGLKAPKITTIRDIQTLTNIAKELFGWSGEPQRHEHLHLHKVSRLVDNHLEI